MFKYVLVSWKTIAKFFQCQPVMVNFICQLEWAIGSQIKQCFWVCLWGCCQMIVAFELVDFVDCPTQCGLA